MSDRYKHIWNWYWRERSGVLLFRHIRGAKRLTFELPLMLLGAWAWYFYLFSLPNSGRNWFLCMFLNPFGVVGILCLVAHEIGVHYLRDQLQHDARLTTRLILCVPGRATALYKEQYGSDLLVNFVRGIRFVAFGSLAVGMLVCNWGPIFRR